MVPASSCSHYVPITILILIAYLSVEFYFQKMVGVDAENITLLWFAPRRPAQAGM